MASALTIAAAGEVGGDFFRERSSGTLPCQAQSDHVFCFDWAKDNIDRFGTPTVQQIELVVLSLLLGFAIAFALALFAHRRAWLRPPLLAGTGVLFTIPSLAFFFLLLPITGYGRDTAIIVLAAYTLQIIYRNMMVGLDNVPDSAKTAAEGMGMTARQILWRIELPLAIPEIVAGLRIASLSTMAIATLAVFIAGEGLGTQIYGSGNLTFPTSIIIAAAIAMAAALVLDVIFLAAQRLMTPWRRARAG